MKGKRNNKQDMHQLYPPSPSIIIKINIWFSYLKNVESYTLVIFLALKQKANCFMDLHVSKYLLEREKSTARVAYSYMYH